MNCNWSMSIILLVAGCLMSTLALNDKEIETIKGLVDKELIKRELDLLKEGTDRKNDIVHPLGGRVNPTTAQPRPKEPAPKSEEPAPKSAPANPTKTTRPTPKPTLHPDESLQMSIDNCIDIYDTQKCQVLVNEGMDCSKDDMHLLCEKTCGFCGNHGFPVDCLTTDFGCCGDNLTPRTDPSGKNCPKCKDMVPELCEPHVNDCNEIGMVGNWMRANCKKSCEVCVPGREAGAIVRPPCEDDKDQAMFCPHWKKNGLCKEIPVLMKTHCQKTCDLCES